MIGVLRVKRYTLTSPAGKMALISTPAEWADVTYDRLIALGCSEKYALKVSRRIARAQLA